MLKYMFRDNDYRLSFSLESWLLWNGSNNLLGLVGIYDVEFAINP